MHRLLVSLAIGALGLAGVGGCGDKKAEEGAAAPLPGLEQEAQGLEHAAEKGAVAGAAGAVERGAEQAAKDVEKQGVVGTAKDVGKDLEGNVERSAQAYDKTYQEKRAAGEGVVGATGEAYDSVLDEPDEEQKGQN